MFSTPLCRGLIDTAILIGIRQGDHDAYLFALELLKHNSIEVSELSAMTLICRCLDTAERTSLLGVLPSCKVYRITAVISRRARRILESLPPPSMLTADDAIIAVMAIVNKLPLYTVDPTRFVGIAGLTTIKPY